MEKESSRIATSVTVVLNSSDLRYRHWACGPSLWVSCSPAPPALAGAPQRVVLAERVQRGCLCQFTKGNISQTVPRALSRVCLPEGRCTGMMQTAKCSVSELSNLTSSRRECRSTQNNDTVFPQGLKLQRGREALASVWASCR